MMPAGAQGGPPTDLLKTWQTDAVGRGKCWAQEADTPGFYTPGTKTAEAARREAEDW